jgi:hypothetical protein
MKIKIECEIEIDEDVWYNDEDEKQWVISLLDNEEEMTMVRLWSCEVGDEMGVTSNFKYKIL